MQNNVNQTNQKDPDNRGQNGVDFLPDELCSIWLEVSFSTGTPFVGSMVAS